MTTYPSNLTITTARQLHEKLAKNGLPPKLAKLYSQNIRLQQNHPGLPSWRAEEVALRLSEAVRLVDAALLEREVGFLDWQQGMHRAAELLEWLSHPKLNTDHLPLRLLAVAAYQIAGYPARSGSLLATEANEGNESAILRAFLCADFPETFHELGIYWTRSKENPTVATLTTEEPLEEALVTAVVSALGVLCAEMRWGGENRLDKALEKLQAVAKLQLFGRDSYSWLLARLCAEVAATFVQSALRKTVQGLRAGLTPTGEEAIERYLRQKYLVKQSLAWPSQREGIEQLLTGENFALCTPTGSGKTTLAEIAILKGLFQRKVEEENPLSRLVLYLVPSRALAAEVEARLSRVVRRLGERVNIVVTGLYGGTDWGLTDTWITSDEPTVLICTYEKAEALIRFLGPLFIPRLSLLIIDEAHNINFHGNLKELANADSRALRLEVLCARLFSYLGGPHNQIVALSAVASGSDTTLACWLNGQEDASATSTTYRSMRQLVGRLHCTDHQFRIQYDLLDGTSLRCADEGEERILTISDPFPPVPAAKGFTGPEKHLRPSLFWAAMHLANFDQEKHTVLIAITEKIGGYAQDFLDLLEKQWVAETPLFFVPPTTGKPLEVWQTCLASCEDYFGKKSREYRLLEKGILVHHGKMPGHLARKMVELIQSGVVHIVLATSTLTEGVNLPFDTILIPNLKRYSGEMTVQEFANLVGRAGRPGLAAEGQSLVLIPQADYHGLEVRQRYNELLREMCNQASRSTAEGASPLANLLVHLEKCWRGLHPHGTPADFDDWLEQTATIEAESEVTVSTPSEAIETLDTLDGILLAATVETEALANSSTLSAGEIEDRLKRVWQRSYARYASDEQTRLCDIFVRRGKALTATILPDTQRRKRLYQTSLSPRAGSILLRLYPVIQQHLVSGRGYARMSSQQRLEYITGLLTPIGGMPHFAFPHLTRTPPAETLLHWWLSPETSPQTPTPTNISYWHEYIAKYFIYRFNWALGSVLSLRIQEVHEGDLRATSLEAWPLTDFPWVVLWLKELLTWGTLEPVAAYLLTRGMAITRPEAVEKSQGYYESRSDEEDVEDLLHPIKIRKWAERTYPKTPPPSSLWPPEIGVTLARDFSSVPTREWRVLPVPQDNLISWYDPAGFLMGTSIKPYQWEDSWADTFDFHLDSVEKTVSSKVFSYF